MENPDYTTHKEVARANNAFYGAFRARDPEAMARAWMDLPSVRCIHPGGEILVGSEQVQASWAAILTQGEALHIEVTDLEVDLLGDAGWVTCVERLHPLREPDGPAAEVATTNLFLCGEEGWRMVLHHASPMRRRQDPR